jgi:hypothetical protein
MQKWHQSDPVKSTSIALFSLAALALAASKSVIHSAAMAGITHARAAAAKHIHFFIIP